MRISRGTDTRTDADTNVQARPALKYTHARNGRRKFGEEKAGDVEKTEQELNDPPSPLPEQKTAHNTHRATYTKTCSTWTRKTKHTKKTHHQENETRSSHSNLTNSHTATRPHNDSQPHTQDDTFKLRGHKTTDTRKSTWHD